MSVSAARREHTPALTGLALLTMHEQRDARYDDAILKGVQTLLSMQREDGCFGGDDAFMLYNHGIAAVTLLRLHLQGTLPQDVRQSVEQAIRFIRASQLAEGGWGYRPDDTAANVSVSAWQLEALGLARHLGWDDSRGHLRRGLWWMTQLVDDSGIVGYQREGGGTAVSRVTTTAQGIHCLLHAGEGIQGAQEPVAKMVQRLNEMLENPAIVETKNPYRDYFVAQALGTSPSAHIKALVKTNVRDGKLKGSWNAEDTYSKVGGRLCSTTFSSLALK